MNSPVKRPRAQSDVNGVVSPASKKTAKKLPVLLLSGFLGAGKTTTLKIRGSYHPHGDWQLRVLADKDVLADQIVSYKNIQEEWFNLGVDLSRFGGKTITLSVENRANDWMNEFGYWPSVCCRSVRKSI